MEMACDSNELLYIMHNKCIPIKCQDQKQTILANPWTITIIGGEFCHLLCVTWDSSVMFNANRQDIFRLQLIQNG